jgi:hypothetical protein
MHEGYTVMLDSLAAVGTLEQLGANQSAITAEQMFLFFLSLVFLFIFPFLLVLVSISLAGISLLLFISLLFFLFHCKRTC